MPYDPTFKAVRGDDALAPLDWARRVFCEWLAGKLNDPSGPYASKLALTEERPAFVLEDTAIARAMYKRADSPPVVGLMQGASDAQDWYVIVNDIEEKGERISLEWALDCGVKDATPDDDDLALERRDDSNVAAFVRDAVTKGYNELSGLGLFDVNIEADTEKQRAGQGRHPHAITLFIRVLP